MPRSLSWREEFQRGTLFAKTTTLIALVSALFFTLSVVLLAWLILIPTGQRAAEELGSKMRLAAEAWSHLTREQQPHFSEQLQQNHHLWLYDQLPTDAETITHHTPFFLMLESYLTEINGEKAHLYQNSHARLNGIYMARIRLPQREVAVGFRYRHERLEPPVTVGLILLIGISALLTTTTFFVRRLTRPLTQLSEATYQVGSGRPFTPLTADLQQPYEIRQLITNFNQMAEQIETLITNRTTLLAGISHDLRSPLARMAVAVEMLQERPNPMLLQRLERDMGQMNHLIGLFLEISRGLHEEKRERIDLLPLLSEIAEEFRAAGRDLIWHPPAGRCQQKIHPLALRRMVHNLLENAVRYSGGQQVELRCRAGDPATGTILVIEVLDRGPGLTAEESEAVFQPFYRLEHSRSEETGGSGLGLSIVRQLAQANHCTVRLLPRDGGGTCAEITLQAAKWL